MTSLYATIAPHFTQDLLSPGLKVGYYDDGGIWQFIAPSLALRLPLRAIEWKNLVGVTKTIDRLPLNFIAKPESEPTMPIVCIYVIKCEEIERYKSTVRAQIAQWIDRMNVAKVDWMLLYVPLGTRTKTGASGGSSSNSTGRHASHSVYKKIFEKIKNDFANKKSASSHSTSSTNASSSSSSSASGGGGGGGASGGSSGSTSDQSRSSGSAAASAMSSGLSNLGNSLAGIGGGGSANGVSIDRICKIDTLEGASVVGTQSTHELQWTELLLKMRKCIMEAFECKCLQYEEEVRLLDAKRSLPSWDFSAFFVAKERLALMYQQTYLLDDAIRHLDELEAIFVFLVQSDKRFQATSSSSTTTTTTRPLASTDPIFTVSALAVDMAAMHRQIASNQAPPLLMRLYFFSRQIRTLYLMGDFRQLIQRAVVFITSFHELLIHEQEEQRSPPHSDLKWFQPHLWAAGACLEIAYACELSWSGHDYQISSASIPEGISFALTPEVMAGLLGDILYLARRMLKKSAKSNGWWSMAPSSMESKSFVEAAATIVPVEETEIPSPSSAWYSSLQTMFEAPTPDLFQRCVWELSHLASLHFSRAGRHRFAVFLGGECARYHFRHREFESASRLFRSHARQCEEDKWWPLVSDCVKRICDCELALDRSAQAVGACFSMLEIAQGSKAEVSRAYLDQLLTSLVQSLDRSGKHATDGDGDVTDGDGDVTDGTTAVRKSHRVKMGELIKPAMQIETMQSPESDLDYGDVRVTLALSNQFPAGIHIESVRIRFMKCDDDKIQEKSPATMETVGLETPVDDGTTDCLELTNQQATNEVKSALSLVELEESNVYLYERASVNLIFLYGDVEVGQYVCTGLECTVAGNAFPLFSKSDLEAIRFEIPSRKSTLQLHISGPPLFTPASMEEICITIDSEDDDVHQGVLEIVLPENCTAVSLSHAQLRGPHGHGALSDPSQRPHQPDTEPLPPPHEQAGRKLVLEVANLPAKTRVAYSVWLIIGDVTEDAETAAVVVVPVAASLRYEEGSIAAKCHTELRRSECAFKVMRPLVETTRLKRFDDRVFVAVALTCNADCGVWLRDYGFHNDAVATLDDDPTTHTLPPSPGQALTLFQDLNGHLRDHHLAPSETVHMAFGLRIEHNKPLPAKALLRVGIEFDCTDGTGQDSWRTNSLIELPIATIDGPVYQIDVQPTKTAASSRGGALEFTMADDIVFHVTVHELRGCASGDNENPYKLPQTLLLCLDEASETEWILLGKQHEAFTFSRENKATSSSSSSTRWEFVTTKRMMPLRIGRLRFPQFQLREAPSYPVNAIPSQRVFCAQLAKTILVV